MKKVLRWITLIWALFSVPYALEGATGTEAFFILIFAGLIIGIMIDDLRMFDKEEK